MLKTVKAKPELTTEQKAIYENVLNSLKENISNAIEYAKRGCSNCIGKGYTSFDNVLSPTQRQYIPVNEEIELPDGKKTTKRVGFKIIKFTPVETKLCECVEKQVNKEVRELENE